MILQLTIQVDEDKVKECIAAAWQARYGTELSVDKISPIKVKDKINDTDIENMTTGSCLGELINQSESVVMGRIS